MIRLFIAKLNIVLFFVVVPFSSFDEICFLRSLKNMFLKKKVIDYAESHKKF